MGKYLVEVKVDWDNLFIVNAENKEKAAAKAWEAMADLMDYNISYDTEDENAEMVGEWDNIKVVNTIECEEEEATNEIKGLKEWIEKKGYIPMMEKYAEVME